MTVVVAGGVDILLVVVLPTVDCRSVVASSVVGKSVVVAGGVDILRVVLASSVDRGLLVEDSAVVALQQLLLLVVCRDVEAEDDNDWVVPSCVVIS